MDKGMLTYLIIGFVIGFIICFIFISVISPKARKYAKVKQELDQTKDELIAQKQMIAKHFSHSAEILDNMAKDFRRLYQHMAENSSQFMDSGNIQALDFDSNTDSNETKEITLDKQPRDYSDDSSGLFKTDENKS
ncbi:YhcB family protein [Gilliamella sp. BG6]|uniref:YhcB family protein n=1 Tax=unclassified Gilliamella TaxID=2685620 RepID=UPI003987630E|nr:YhcB family protein [Gilliamella sp.]MCO6554999.1 YhcB family protein [Gilliamella sp.]